MDNNSFVDGNGVTVRPPDEVQYKFGARHGELVNVFSDGDADVQFFDNPGATELVKWHHLCGVPEEYRVGPSAPGTPSPSSSVPVVRVAGSEPLRTAHEGE